MTLPPILSELLISLAAIAAFYVAGASLCRMGIARGREMRHGWIWLYVGVFATAMWMLVDSWTGGGTVKDAWLTLCVAGYIWMTRAAWAQGLPAVVRRPVSVREAPAEWRDRCDPIRSAQ